jgi:membrane-associated phospholipid phosphatase
MAIRSLLVAVVAFVCVFALGFDVSRNGEPALLLGWERALFDHSTLIAWWLTWLCYLQVLAPVAVGLLIVAWLVPSWRTRIFFSIAILLLCWRGVDLLQRVFDRPRPLHWVVKHETAFSYPSSHAAIAFGFYGLWAVMLYWSDLSVTVRRVAGVTLAALVLAICWSRLALGAHYVSDLAGGALFAIGLVAAGLALVPIAPFRIAGRVYKGENTAV